MAFVVVVAKSREQQDVFYLFNCTKVAKILNLYSSWY